MLENMEWLFLDIGSTFVNEEKCYERRIAETLIQKNAPSIDLFIETMTKYANNNEDAYKCAIKEFGLNKAAWYSEDEFLYPNARNILERLHKRFKLGIIANQVLGTAQRLKEFGIISCFDLITASAEEGVSKPNLEIFEIALQRAGCKPTNAIMVGDRLDNDIIPAQQIGMTTIWVRQGWGGMGNPLLIDMKPDYCIDKFEDILRIVEL